MRYQIVRESEPPPTGQKPVGIPRIHPEEPLWKLSDIVLPSNILETVEEVAAFVTHRHTLMVEWQFNRFIRHEGALCVNLFGPPGTGKSITAEAVANRLGKKIVRIDYGDLESKYPGQTSENLARVFAATQEAGTPGCVLFFDEADGILGKRISNLSQAADHGINTAKGKLLTLLDKSDAIVIFSTNKLENYDSAFLRRILFHIEFHLPDLHMRTQLWKLHLHERVPRTVSYEEAAELGEGLSGGEIKNVAIRLCLQLLTGKLREITPDALRGEVERVRLVRAANLTGPP